MLSDTIIGSIFAGKYFPPRHARGAFPDSHNTFIVAAAQRAATRFTTMPLANMRLLTPRYYADG